MRKPFFFVTVETIISKGRRAANKPERAHEKIWDKNKNITGECTFAARFKFLACVFGVSHIYLAYTEIYKRERENISFYLFRISVLSRIKNFNLIYLNNKNH